MDAVRFTEASLGIIPHCTASNLRIFLVQTFVRSYPVGFPYVMSSNNNRTLST
jgi:hypothetical protein